MLCHQISTQFSIYGRFWSNVLGSALHCYYQPLFSVSSCALTSAEQNRCTNCQSRRVISARSAGTRLTICNSKQF